MPSHTLTYSQQHAQPNCVQGQSFTTASSLPQNEQAITTQSNSVDHSTQQSHSGQSNGYYPPVLPESLAPDIQMSAPPASSVTQTNSHVGTNPKPQVQQLYSQTSTGNTLHGTWTGTSTLTYTQSMQPPDVRSQGGYCKFPLNHLSVPSRCNLAFD